MAGPGNEMAAGAAGRGRLRASHADREQVIDTLKTAFVRGVLAKDQFDLRVGLTFASRTNAELAAVTADIPARLTAAQPPEWRPARAQGERPVLRPGRVITVATALCAGMWAWALLFPWPRNSEGDPTAAIVLVPMLTLAYLYLVLVVAGVVVADRREKRSGGGPGAASARRGRSGIRASAISRPGWTVSAGRSRSPGHRRSCTKPSSPHAIARLAVTAPRALPRAPSTRSATTGH